MKQAMIFAAGLGTRLKPLTDTMPKALVRVGGQPLLWHVVTRLRAAGFGRIVINVHHFAQQIVDYVEANGRFGVDIRISDETGRLLETGGGIRHAQPLFDASSPILIHNVDILSNLDLQTVYDAADRQSLLVVSQRTTKRYLQFDDNLRLVGWKNVETGQLRGCEGRSLAFSGVHVFSPTLFPLMASWPDRFPIIDFYLDVCDRCTITGYEAPGLRLMDVGKLDTLDDANEFINTL